MSTPADFANVAAVMRFNAEARPWRQSSSGRWDLADCRSKAVRHKSEQAGNSRFDVGQVMSFSRD